MSCRPVGVDGPAGGVAALSEVWTGEPASGFPRSGGSAASQASEWDVRPPAPTTRTVSRPRRSRQRVVRKNGLVRVVLATGTFVSLLLAVISLLDQNIGSAGLFGFAAVVCIVGLVGAARAGRDQPR